MFNKNSGEGQIGKTLLKLKEAILSKHKKDSSIPKVVFRQMILDISVFHLVSHITSKTVDKVFCKTHNKPHPPEISFQIK